MGADSGAAGTPASVPRPDGSWAADVHAEMRRWRLVARLDDAARRGGDSWPRIASSAAELIADELGDIALVVVLDAPGQRTPTVSVARRDTAPPTVAADLVARASADDLRAAAHSVAAADQAVSVGLPRSAAGWLADACRSYDNDGDQATLAFAALRVDGEVLGFVGCARDRDAGGYTSADAATMAAAANKIAMLAHEARVSAGRDAERRERVLAFELAPIGMCTCDPQGRLTAVNASGCAIFGRAESELLGRTLEGYFHPDDLEDYRADQARMLTGEQTGSAVRTFRIVRGVGETRWIRCVRMLVRDEGGRPLAFHVQFSDFTAQYRAEERAARFESLVLSSPDFIAITDLDGRMQFLNPAGRRMVGLPEDADTTRMQADDFWPPEPDDDEAPAVGTAAGRWQATSTVRDWRDGSQIPVLSTTFVIHDLHTGEPVARATKRRDIREQIAAQRTLEALAEQRRLLLHELIDTEQNERRRLAEDLHDEPVQLLAAAQLRLQLFAMQHTTSEAGAAGQSVRDITDVVDEALRALRQILADLEPPDHGDRSLRESLHGSARVHFAGTEVGVHVDGDLLDLPPDATAALHRSVREALSNARRHAFAGNVWVVLRDEPERWSVSIEDDGVGIAGHRPERRGHLGIRAMTSRIEALGGSVVIGRRDEGGTRVGLTIPRSG